jgi:hypothetical protein
VALVQQSHPAHCLKLDASASGLDPPMRIDIAGSRHPKGSEQSP